jgi:4-hydroxy-tetrahydrodipicolinate synthase
MKLNNTACGVFPIAPTAFHSNGDIDFDSMQKLTDFYVDSGCKGITVLGQLGEAPKLSHEESIQVTTQMIQRAQSIPVIVGVSAPGFASMRALTQEVMGKGAAGVMIAPPNTLRTDDQIVQYYQTASRLIGDDVPIVIQDYPLTFSVQMSPSVIQKIVNSVSSVVMLKHEDWPGLEKISTLRGHEASNSMRKIAILCGNGGLFLDFELQRGADGINTGYCFPDMLVELYSLIVAGEIDQAHDLFDAHLPLIRYEQQPGVGLAVRKYILQKRGLLKSDAQRVPANKLSHDAIKEVDFLLKRLSTKDSRAVF